MFDGAIKTKKQIKHVVNQTTLTATLRGLNQCSMLSNWIGSLNKAGESGPQYPTLQSNCNPKYVEAS